jgi:hypothetical protein
MLTKQDNAYSVPRLAISENKNQYDAASRKTERNSQSKQYGAFAFTLSY